MNRVTYTACCGSLPLQFDQIHSQMTTYVMVSPHLLIELGRTQGSRVENQGAAKCSLRPLAACFSCWTPLMGLGVVQGIIARGISMTIFGGNEQLVS